MAAALLGSLAGDVFLMFQGYFIPGLVSFLVAHLFYVALFKQGQRWFAHRGALVATLGTGVAMYTFLWLGGLPAALRGPVAAYVLVIALMAAQALGRASTLRDAPSLWVAIGAVFLCSAIRCWPPTVSCSHCPWRRSGCWAPTTRRRR